MSTGPLKKNISNFCKDPESALALYLRVFIPGAAKINAKHYGINRSIMEEAFNIIPQDYLSNGLDHELEGIVISCINKFSEDLADYSIKKIEELKELNSSKFEDLSYMLYILKYSESHISSYIMNYIGDFVDAHQFVGSLCVMLQRKYKEADSYARKLLARTGLAFSSYYEETTNEHTPHYYVIPPYAKKIINEHAERVESNLKPLIDQVLNSDDAELLSSILIALHGGKGSYIFDAVYGEDWYNYIKKINFPYYQGYTNYVIERILNKTIIEKVLNNAPIKNIKNALQSNGFKIERTEFIKNEHWYNTYLVSKNDYKVAIYIMPFPYKLPKEEEKEVIVFIGPIAKPDVFKNYVVVGLDNDLKVSQIIDNVGKDWSREIVDVFKSLNPSTSVSSLKNPNDSYEAEREFIFPNLVLPTPRPKEELINEVVKAAEKFRQVILIGPPGTGKSHLAMWAAHRLTDDGRNGSWTMIQFHKNYRYDDFIERMTLKPREGGTDLVREPQLFVRLCRYAQQHPDKKVVLVIDEINRADVASVFGELLLALEYRRSEVRLAYSGEPCKVPDNLYIIATANDIDRGTFDIGVALRRRFAVVRTDTSETELRKLLTAQGIQEENVIKDTVKIFNVVNNLFENSIGKKGVGHLFFKEVKDMESLKDTWNYKIKPLVDEYFSAPGVVSDKEKNEINNIDEQLNGRNDDQHG